MILFLKFDRGLAHVAVGASGCQTLAKAAQGRGRTGVAHTAQASLDTHRQESHESKSLLLARFCRLRAAYELAVCQRGARELFGTQRAYDQKLPLCCDIYAK